MRRSIKVSDKVYQALLEEQRPRETFDDVVNRLLEIKAKVMELIEVMNKVPAYLAWKASHGGTP
jgi:predicted CopG family antitoxin